MDVKRRVGCVLESLSEVVGDGSVDLSGDVELEAADDLASCSALREPSVHVVLGRLVPSQPADDDDVERGVGLAVATAVESVTLLPPGGRVER